MKRTLSLILMLILIVALLPCAASAKGDPSFLIGDWSTSDGVTLSFYDDGYFELAWSFLPAEEGRWQAEAVSDDTFLIEMDGSSILYLMSLIYGTGDPDYHFEVLKCNGDNFYLVQVYGDYTAKTSPCKLGFTRDGCARDFSYREDPADTGADRDADVRTESFTWHIDGHEDFVLDMHWGWSLFDKSATVYDHDLAMAGLAISSIIHEREDFRDRLESYFGFEDVDYRPYASPLIPAFAMAHRRAVLSGGEKEIVLLAVRGTNLGLDQLNDLIDDLSSQFDGFRPATVAINSALDDYVSRHGFKKEETILFITGHSLGGAIAQSMAPYAENYVTSDDDCFIYTYAAANCLIDVFHNRDFGNVHNIINERDAVPKVPFVFGKYGHRWFYASQDLKYRPYYEKVYHEEGWHCRNVLDEHSTATYLAMMLCDLPYNMGSGAVNPYSVTSVRCPVDIQVFDRDGNLMGSTSGDDVTMEAASRILILTHSGEKEIVSPSDEEYSVRITGTDEGTMTVVRQMRDPETDEVLTEKTFADVPVTKGGVYELAAGADDAARTDLRSGGASISEREKEERTEVPGGTAAAETEKKEGSGTTLLIIAVVVLAVIVVILLLLLLLKKRR